jgi:hypothetical protein
MIKRFLFLLILFALTTIAFAEVDSNTQVVTIQKGLAKRAPVNEVAQFGVAGVPIAPSSVTTSSWSKTSYNVGVTESISGTQTSTEYGNGVVHKTVFTMADTEFTFVDDGTNGHVATKLYTFPEGYVQVLGASTNLSCASAGTFGATGTASFGIGTAATADATLATTEVNIVASTSSGAFVASVGTLLGGPVAAPLQVDGHTTAGALYLNLADATDPADDSVLTCSGTITVSWIHHGDN